VAVACGFTSFELGTDIGGSVRIPSHFCGIYGLKPSFGVVPQRGYLDHVGGGTTDADINVFGPMARSADDLDLILSVMAGPAPERAAGWQLELPPPRHEGLRSYKIGVWFEQPECPLDPDILGVLSDAVDVAAASGVRIERAHPPVDFAEQTALFLQLIAAALSSSAEPELQDAMAGGHAAWLAADRQRARLQRAWAEWFGTYDLLLCPVTPTAAFSHHQDDDVVARTVRIAGMDVPYVNHVIWTGLIGVVGLPAAVPPIGRTPSGLPVGVQVVAPFLRDRDAVHAAGELAELVGGGFTPPPGF
jgi:amidase